MQVGRLWLSLWWLVLAVAMLQMAWNHGQLSSLSFVVDELHPGPVISNKDDFFERALEIINRRRSILSVFSLILNSTFFATLATQLAISQFVSAYAITQLRPDRVESSFMANIASALQHAVLTLAPSLVQRLYLALLQTPLMLGALQILWPQPQLDTMAVTALLGLFWLWSLLWIAVDHTRSIILTQVPQPYHPKHALKGLGRLLREPQTTLLAWLLWHVQLGLGLFPLFLETQGRLSLDSPWISLLYLGGIAALAQLRYLLVQVHSIPEEQRSQPKASSRA